MGYKIFCDHKIVVRDKCYEYISAKSIVKFVLAFKRSFIYSISIVNYKKKVL